MRIALHKKNGSRSGNWQGGSYYVKNIDTWFTYAPNHPKAKDGGGVPTHILVAEKRIGRFLFKGEIVHHLDLVRFNSAPENLCVMSCSNHLILHRTLGTVGIKLIISGHSSLVMSTMPHSKAKKIIELVYLQKMALITNLDLEL